MKLLTKILLILFLGFEVLHAQDCTAELSVKTNIPSSQIYINNKLTGTGSLNINLEKGSYTLYVVKDSISWNPESFTDSIVIEDCSNKSFSYNFSKQFYLQSLPNDSYVYDNDSLVGHTPLHLSGNFAGLRLAKPGYQDSIINLNSFDSERIVRLNPVENNNEELPVKKVIFKVLVGTALVLGGITAYYKLKADDYFEEYQITGSSAALNKTVQYDTISGITIAALQINFGLLIYLFLSE